MIDVDVPPSVAVHDANLGDIDELTECIERSTMIKPTLEAAVELLGLNLTEHQSENMEHDEACDVAKALKSRLIESAFIAITNGKKGAVMATNDHIVGIDPLCNILQVDSTGAGDAFFGL